MNFECLLEIHHVESPLVKGHKVRLGILSQACLLVLAISFPIKCLMVFE